MRTRLTPLIFATAALAGCATAPRVHGVAPEAPPPLRVWVAFPIGSSQVYPIFTNREAHVAMFEIIPGRGVTMVYPLHQGHAIASTAHYANLTLQPGRMFYYTDPFGHASYEPRYYYAVASTAPLNLQRLQTSLGAMRRVLGPMYASYRPYDVIDRVTGIVVPMQADEDWATDLFVDWPEMPVRPRFASSQIVRCANGRTFQAPAGYPYHGCPGDAKPVVTATTTAALEPAPPAKELALEGPRAPRRGTDREGVSLSSPGVDRRRRAEPGARAPIADARARGPRSGVHYDGRESGPSPVRSARGARSGGSDSVRNARDSSSPSSSAEPASSSKPARSGAESGGSEKAKKPR